MFTCPKMQERQKISAASCQRSNNRSWKKKKNSNLRGPCSLKGEAKHDFPEDFTSLGVFERVTRHDILVEVLASGCKLYSQQSGRSFFTKSDEMKVFIGIRPSILYHMCECTGIAIVW